MKKKAIEKIPYLKLPRVSRKRAVEHVAVSDVREIDHVPHLIIEVYRNKKECKEIPVCRIVITEKDFGTYFPESGEWVRKKIVRNTWDDYGLIWTDERVGKTVNVMAEGNILHSESDLKRIRKFLKDDTASEEGGWWEAVDWKQRNILLEERNAKESRRRERRKRNLRERQDNTPELPEEEIIEYADVCFFRKEHRLYYKKNGARATIACSNCGEITDGRWKPGQSFESQFERKVEEPRQGAYGTCQRCKVRGKYVPQGKARDTQYESKHLFLGQKYKGSGMVFRYIKTQKEWRVEVALGDKDLEILGAYEKVRCVEMARAYFEPGKKLQKDYRKYDSYSGKNFWDDCNLAGPQNITIRAAQIMPETYENMKGTFLQYSALKEYQGVKGELNPLDYLERYIQTPQIEMLVKLGLTKVVDQLVKCRYGIVADVDANRVDAFLGIRRERTRQLMRHQGEQGILNVMQAEKRLGKKWTEEQVEWLAEIDLSGEITWLSEYMGVQKLLNQVSKYAGCGYGTMCGQAEEKLRQTATTYLDYLNMRKKLGYDMQNTVYLFPKNLGQAHMKMVTEQNKAETERRIEEAERAFPLIRKRYGQLRKRFYFRDEEFMIRPARSAREIVMEGRILHHCVGDDRYLNKHNGGRSVILLLRSREEPKVPYITVEIDPETLRIEQWYGAWDKKPDRERVQGWLDNYVDRLKCGGTAAGQEAGNGMEQRVLVYA